MDDRVKPISDELDRIRYSLATIRGNAYSGRPLTWQEKLGEWWMRARHLFRRESIEQSLNKRFDRLLEQLEVVSRQTAVQVGGLPSVRHVEIEVLMPKAAALKMELREQAHSFHIDGMRRENQLRLVERELERHQKQILEFAQAAHIKPYHDSAEGARELERLNRLQTSIGAAESDIAQLLMALKRGDGSTFFPVIEPLQDCREELGKLFRATTEFIFFTGEQVVRLKQEESSRSY
jgi:hypothetical protein